MNRKIRLISGLAALFIFTAVSAIFLLRGPVTTMFDLRDGTRLEIIHISFSTNHIAHFGTLSQKILFKIAGTRLSPKWVGYQMVTPSQDSINGNLGIFVRHHLGPGDHPVSAFHNLKIKPFSEPRKEHPMLLSSGHGEFGLWEQNYWTENHPRFRIENSKGELVGLFRILKNKPGRYKIEPLDLSTGTEQLSRSNSF